MNDTSRVFKHRRCEQSSGLGIANVRVPLPPDIRESCAEPRFEGCAKALRIPRRTLVAAVLLASSVLVPCYAQMQLPSTLGLTNFEDGFATPG